MFNGICFSLGLSLQNPEVISVDDDNAGLGSVGAITPALLTHHFCIVPAKQRLVALSALLIEKCLLRATGQKVLIFMASQDMVDYHTVLFRRTLARWVRKSLDTIPFSGQFLTNEIQFHTNEIQFHTNENQFHTNEIQFHTNEIQFHTNEIQFHTNEIQFHTNEIHFHTSEIQFHTNWIQIHQNENSISDFWK